MIDSDLASLALDLLGMAVIVLIVVMAVLARDRRRR